MSTTKDNDVGVQKNFLLSAAAKDLKPRDAASLSGDEAYERFKDIRWGWQQGRPYCPHCGHEKPWEYATRALFKCPKCGRQFSITAKTAFADRKMPFKTLLSALAIRVHSPMNAHRLSHTLGLKYRSGARILTKMRLFGGNIATSTRETRWPFRLSNGPAEPDLVQRVSALLPPGLPEQVRADVGQDIILGVLAGDITEALLAEDVRRYLRTHYSSMEWKFNMISLSAPVPGTNGMPWDDILASDVEHF